MEVPKYVQPTSHLQSLIRGLTLFIRLHNLTSGDRRSLPRDCSVNQSKGFEAEPGCCCRGSDSKISRANPDL